MKFQTVHDILHLTNWTFVSYQLLAFRNRITGQINGVIVILQVRAQSGIKLNSKSKYVHDILRRETREISEFVDESWKKFNPVTVWST